MIRHLITDASHLGETEVELAKQGVSAQAEARLRSAGEERPGAAAARPAAEPVGAMPGVDALAEEV